MKKNEFDPSVTYRFTRPMKWNGKYVATGTLLPADGTPIGILRSLFKMRQIELADGSEPEQQPEQQPEQPGAVAEIRNEGSGWYNVYMGGMLISEKKLRKDDAEKWCEEKGLTYNIS